MGFIEAFDAVHGYEANSSFPYIQNWVAPLSGWVKINYDASLAEDELGKRLGCCILNSEGVVLFALASF